MVLTECHAGLRIGEDIRSYDVTTSGQDDVFTIQISAVSKRLASSWNVSRG